MTPAIVPGLAANRIKGVRDGVESVDAPDEGVLPLSIENPIHANTPPPATIKASRDTPNRCNTLPGEGSAQEDREDCQSRLRGVGKPAAA